MIQELFNLIGISPFTVLHWIFAISLTLFILDIFFQTEVISWGALFFITVYFTSLTSSMLDIPMQWDILIFIIYLALAFTFYYTIWYSIVGSAAKKTLLRKATPEQHERVVNESGVFRIIEGQYFVEWNGELWNASSKEDIKNFTDKELVKIEKSEAGCLFIVKK
ncbi:MAG: hypothetical protein R3Y46_01590 [Opitutales bacterium]